jgi:PIN domain nuclease of toxin-antitoxin system
VILLDTNAVLWLLTGHRRAAELAGSASRLFLSPVTLLELKFLIECGRLEERDEGALDQVAADPRWKVDNPTTERLFHAALPLDWTRDPFDRLLVAHARYRRWRLATGDRSLQEQLPAEMVLAL